MAGNAFVAKFSTLLCLECSIWMMFFSSSFTVSIMLLSWATACPKHSSKSPSCSSSTWLSTVCHPQRDGGIGSCWYSPCHRQACHKALLRKSCTPMASCHQLPQGIIMKFSSSPRSCKSDGFWNRRTSPWSIFLSARFPWRSCECVSANCWSRYTLKGDCLHIWSLCTCPKWPSSWIW